MKKRLVVVIGLIFAFLFFRLISLQIVERASYDRLAAQNAAKNIPDSAPRGIVYDRYGKVLLESRPVFSVRVFPNVLKTLSPEAREKILRMLGGMLGEEVKLKTTAAEPIFIKDNVSLEIALRIEEKKRELVGVVVSSQPLRYAVHGSLAAHLLGYVGEIESAELEKMRQVGYQLGDIVGKEGVEKIYDEQLRGSPGGSKIEVDVHGAPTRIVSSLDPVAGPEMHLTLDLELQKAAETVLSGVSRPGAAVVLNARTGEILALASYPNYDLNLFTNPSKNWQWKELGMSAHPFLNRALAIYPPGSIFKVVTLCAALGEGKTRPDEVISCPGYYMVNNRRAACWLGSGHGAITVMEGLVWSCDAVFYELGRRVGPDRLAEYARKFGLGARTGVDLPQEKKGTVPDTAWKKERLQEPWYAGDSINYGIGQGFVQVTPLQMALVYAGIATGKIYKPYVVSEIKDKRGTVLYRAVPVVQGEAPASPQNLVLMRQALREVVRRATGVAANVKGIPAAGKTGTAENPGRAHAWFICFAPYDDPEIVIAAFVEHGEHGDRASAYVARDILKWNKEHRLKKVYPEEPAEAQYILHGNYKSPYGGSGNSR
jgi:penicillin-binding protein 2